MPNACHFSTDRNEVASPVVPPGPTGCRRGVHKYVIRIPDRSVNTRSNHMYRPRPDRSVNVRLRLGQYDRSSPMAVIDCGFTPSGSEKARSSDCRAEIQKMTELDAMVDANDASNEAMCWKNHCCFRPTSRLAPRLFQQAVPNSHELRVPSRPIEATLAVAN